MPRSPSELRASRSTRSTYTVASTPVPVFGSTSAVPSDSSLPAAPGADRTSRTMISPRPSGTVQRPPLDDVHVSHDTSTSAGRSVCAATSSAARSTAFDTPVLS